MNKELFVQNVKKACKRKGIKPTVACYSSGVGRSFINNIEARGQVPSVEKVQMLAAYLGVTTSELLGEEKKPTPVAEGELDSELWELIQRIPESRMPEVERYLRFQAETQEKP